MTQESHILFRKPPLLGPPLSLPDLSSTHVAALPRDDEGLRAGVALHHGDDVGVQLPLLLHLGLSVV